MASATAEARKGGRAKTLGGCPVGVAPSLVALLDGDADDHKTRGAAAPCPCEKGGVSVCLCGDGRCRWGFLGGKRMF